MRPLEIVSGGFKRRANPDVDVGYVLAVCAGDDGVGHLLRSARLRVIDDEQVAVGHAVSLPDKN